MLNPIALTSTATLLSLLFFLITLMTSKFNLNNKTSTSPFECGFRPLAQIRSSFSIQFFLIAILFIIFDIEIVLILPIPITTMNSSPTLTLLTISFTISLLLLGLFFEWKSGNLNWL